MWRLASRLGSGLTSAMPALYPYTLRLCLVILVMIMLVKLARHEGVRASVGSAYLFIHR